MKLRKDARVQEKNIPVMTRRYQMVEWFDRRRYGYWIPRVALVCGVLMGGTLTDAGADAVQTPVVVTPTIALAFQERMQQLEEGLRCLVCQNQSLADSHADLAADLRREVENLARQGKTDEEIVAFLKARYGDFVSYRPPLHPMTAFLWFGPLLFFGVATGGVVAYTRRRDTRREAPPSLSPEEAVRARTLLGLDEARRR